MYIKEIEIDGFKSYAQTTIVRPFDRHFNAITGLNGSGKSNILDSICFVLGITNLTCVRATHLQELIYKGGNAGVTKATVSITFDNMDKNQSPPGYNDYEEITVTRQISCGGKHKYLINGQNATAQRVADLFCSVQLNVNNPNFLIMQGKITKVLNMKPIETLSMIEETAGTKTYDIKKANALQTIDKKNSKLVEIERIMHEDINPIIEKLKTERSAYIEYQKCEREYLHLHKISIAFSYYQCEETVKKNEKNRENYANQIEKHFQRITEIDEKIDNYKKEIAKIVTSLEKNGDSEQIQELEQALKANQINQTKIKTDLNSKESNLNAEKKRYKNIEKSIQENMNIINSKKSKLDEMKNSVEKIQAEFMQAEASLKKSQQEYEALCCGFVVDDESNQVQTIQDQLLKVKNKLSEHETLIKKAQIKLQGSLKETEKMQKELQSENENYVEKERQFAIQKAHHEKLKAELEALNFDSNNWEKLTVKKRNLSAQVCNLNEKCQSFYSKFPQLNLEYQNPEPNFDRKRVKGLVANLFKLKDPKFSTALETCAGGKLYNLVVDTDKTGKLILQNGGLKRKTTIIPMNQIRAYVINDNIIKTARDLVGSNQVFHALSLIDYAPEYKSVMEFVFGAKFICFDLDTAKKIAYHPQIMQSTITLDGDCFDPEGTLSGGARAERSNILIRLSEMKENIDELNAKQIEMANLEIELSNEREKATLFSRKKNEHDIHLNQLNLAQTSLEQTTHHQKLEKVNKLNLEINEKREEIENSNKELIILKQKQIDLEEKMANGKDTEAEKKQAMKKIDEAKSALEKKLKSSNQLEQEYKSTDLELQVLQNEVTAYNEELTKLDQIVVAFKNESEKLTEGIDNLKDEESNIMTQLNEKKGLIREKNQTVNSKTNECESLDKEKNTINLKVKELEHKKTSLNEDLENSKLSLERLVEANEWINEEKANFGNANTIYDFEKRNIKEIQHRLTDIKQRKEKLSKQVDMRTMGMLAKKEEEYEELNKKRQIVLKDRATLETTIEDLEKLKMEVLLKAFDSINKDFGSIFKTLLPGAFAKLEWVNKDSLLDGLEFKIAFGNVWKESLTELSGGQRSLVALSLILSLLLYKPAPLYILDEVDAALDTSHTQNIGLMIKKYFRHSQFIIVSLKDGMFSNANVLFRTKLVDGLSTVQWYGQKKKDKEALSENNNTSNTSFNKNAFNAMKRL